MAANRPETDHRETIAFLSDPATYGATGPVERLETHISQVFLAGDKAFKLKRAVRFPYLDFSTIERRRAACAAELNLNRRTAPELYLEIRAIVRRSGGRLAWGEDGEIADWVVVMRRFDQAQRLDAIAARGGLEPRLVHALAAHIAAFHAEAEPRPGFGGGPGLAAVIAENDTCLHAGLAAGFDAAQIAALGERSRDWLGRVGDLLDCRRAAGKVRRCHGDLHLRNICVLDGKPVLFDCIEFSEGFASIDVLYDLAFLLMDLAHQGHGASANRLLNRYLDLTGEDDGLAAMPLFLALRAGIRAHVAASAGNDAGEAQAYLAEALAALDAPRPRLVAIGGLSGTGKSTLAAALAPELGARPGARLLRSDVTRKRLFGLAPETPLPAAGYAPEVTGRVYAALRDRAAQTLRAGCCAIVDAVSLRPDERRSLAAVAAAAGVPFTGIWLDAPGAAMTARVAARRDDASDATAAVVARQMEADPGALDWQRIDAGGPPAAILAAARTALGLT
ncbi:MAG TPA: AAA family ATPase [Stellaceae bacterium]|nr:AAA family ATPase [Stellaceae bacterium]